MRAHRSARLSAVAAGIVLLLAAQSALADDKWVYDRVTETVDLDAQGHEAYIFSLTTAQMAEWSIDLVNGSTLSILVLNRIDLNNAIGGGQFDYYQSLSAENAEHLSGSIAVEGSFSILIRTSSNTNDSRYSIDILIKEKPAQEVFWDVICFVAGTIVVVAIVLALLYKFRKDALSSRDAPKGEVRPSSSPVRERRTPMPLRTSPPPVPPSALKPKVAPRRPPRK